MEKTIATLRKLGLNRYESTAYTSLLSLGVSTAGKVAEKATIPRAKIYEVLKNLERDGFVVSNNTRPSKFKAIDVDKVLKRAEKNIERDYEKRLKEIEAIKGELKESLDDISKAPGKDKDEMVWVLKGRDNIYGAVEDMLDKSKKKFIGATTETGIIRKLNKHKEKFARAAKRGVDVRLLAPITTKNGKVVKNIIKDVVIRHGNSVSARFMLSDDDQGILMLNPDDGKIHPDEEIGLHIKSPFFISGMGHYFEHKWDHTSSIEDRVNELKKSN